MLIVRYRREIGAARERLNRLNSQTIVTDVGLTEYARIGEGYPVLVVHGALGGFDQGLWLAQGMGLSMPGVVQIISISRFGHLRSPVPAHANLDLQADAFATNLCPNRPAGATHSRLPAGKRKSVVLAAGGVHPNGYRNLECGQVVGEPLWRTDFHGHQSRQPLSGMLVLQAPISDRDLLFRPEKQRLSHSQKPFGGSYIYLLIKSGSRGQSSALHH